MALNFEKYAQEGNEFVNKLAAELGHPEEKGRAGIILRAVMHTLRERLTISVSFHLLSQIPMFLKGIYVDNWKYREKPLSLNTKEDFTEEVEKHQHAYGEQEFNWDKSTEEIVQIVIGSLRRFISDGEFEDILAQMPPELKELLREAKTSH